MDNEETFEEGYLKLNEQNKAVMKSVLKALEHVQDSPAADGAANAEEKEE